MEAARRAEARAEAELREQTEEAAREAAALELALSHARGDQPPVEGVPITSQQVGQRPGTPVFGERQSTPSDETPTALRRPENVGPVEIAEGVITHQTDIEFTQELYAARNRIHDLEALVSELQNQAEEREATARDRISDLHEALRGQAPRREPNSATLSCSLPCVLRQALSVFGRLSLRRRRPRRSRRRRATCSGRRRRSCSRQRRMRWRRRRRRGVT